MKEIIIEDYNQKWCFSIEKIKIILGKDRYRFYRTLKHQLQKEDKSEYEIDVKPELLVKMNNQRIETKNQKMFIVDFDSNLDEEVKLSTKSLFIEYLESKLKMIDYDDEFIMLNQSIDVLNQSILEDVSIVSDEVKIIFELPKFSYKTLVKNIVSNQIKSNIYSFDFDLTLEEKLNLYLHVLKDLALENSLKNYMFVILLDHLPRKLYEKIYSQEINNLNIIVFAHSFDYDVKYQDIYLIGDKSIDLANDIDVYDHLVIEKGITVDLKSANDLLIKLCNPLNETSKLLDLI